MKRPDSEGLPRENDLPKAAEQFRQSDVTFWGIVALVCGAVAVLSTNVSAVIPQQFLAGLHTSRLTGADMGTLRAQVAALTADAAKLRDTNRELAKRISLADSANGDVTRRVGALEVSIPSLLEAVPLGADIDRSVLTSSIGEKPGQSFDAEGGSVTVRREPLSTAAVSNQAAPGNQALPPILPQAPVYGVAIGPQVNAGNVGATWSDLVNKLGPLVAGYDPLMARDGTGQSHLVAGPISDIAAAAALCKQLEAVAVACLPVPYDGSPVKP
jgi:hypothetical protein